LDFVHTNKSKWCWDFNHYDNTEGWVIPEEFEGKVMGGALCLRISSRERSQMELNQQEKNQIFPREWYSIVSPCNLGIPADKTWIIKMRILNLSPETDGMITCKGIKNSKEYTGSGRFHMSPYLRGWQEVECYLNEDLWDGTVEKISITIGLLGRQGDILIDRISIIEGIQHKYEKKSHPNVNSKDIVPLIKLPGIMQDDIQMAFDVLDECMVIDVPAKGFTYPFIAPGGRYGPCWWQLDTSLALSSLKWVNQKFCEDVIEGFIDVQEQNPDGRIDLWGGSPIRGCVGDISSLPKYIKVAYDIARRSSYVNFQEKVYNSIKNYLRWWLSPVKRDVNTGLIMGVFEESFGVFNWKPQTIAQVDLNVEVAVGCMYTAELAERLGYSRDSVKYRGIFKEIKESINKYMWNEEKGAYYSYNLKKRQLQSQLLCTIFDTFRFNIIPPERVETLLDKLVDQKLFNWNTYPVTSVAKTDETYIEATGDYDGRAWNGNIWTLRNLPIIEGLKDIGRYDLAGKLTWKVIKMFNANYAEFLKPSDGSGQGVKRYAWTASQYIEMIIEHLFGIDYDKQRRLLKVIPNIVEDLNGEEIAINKLRLSGNPETYINIKISNHAYKVFINVEIDGEFIGGMLEVLIPVMKGELVKVIDINRKQEVPVTYWTKGNAKLGGVQLVASSSINLLFETRRNMKKK